MKWLNILTMCFICAIGSAQYDTTWLSTDRAKIVSKFEDGTVASIHHINSMKEKISEERLFYPNGKVRLIREWSNNSVVGTSELFNDSGQLVGNGFWLNNYEIILRTSDSTIMEVTHFNAGVPNGWCQKYDEQGIYKAFWVRNDTITFSLDLAFGAIHLEAFNIDVDCVKLNSNFIDSYMVSESNILEIHYNEGRIEALYFFKNSWPNGVQTNFDKNENSKTFTLNLVGEISPLQVSNLDNYATPLKSQKLEGELVDENFFKWDEEWISFFKRQ